MKMKGFIFFTVIISTSIRIRRLFTLSNALITQYLEKTILRSPGLKLLASFRCKIPRHKRIYFRSKCTGYPDEFLISKPVRHIADPLQKTTALPNNNSGVVEFRSAVEFGSVTVVEFGVRKIVPEKVAPRKIAPRKICPLGKLPPLNLTNIEIQHHRNLYCDRNQKTINL